MGKAGKHDLPAFYICKKMGFSYLSGRSLPGYFSLCKSLRYSRGDFPVCFLKQRLK